MGPGVVKVLRY